jgi:hypothetical protein
VALDNTSSSELSLNFGNSNEMSWQGNTAYNDENYNGVYEDFQINTTYNSLGLNPNNGSSYQSIRTTSKILGYNNTQVLLKYNIYVSPYGYEVYAAESLKNFTEKNLAPNNSSGWYIPSEAELSLIADGAIGETHKTISYSNYVAKNISTIIAALKTSDVKVFGGNSSPTELYDPESSDTALGSWYWSSTEIDNLSTFYLFTGTQNYCISYAPKTDEISVRPVCAF